jgi:triacylglycerol esterase/lipase EstA (alpha/beta hydrolase family)
MNKKEKLDAILESLKKGKNKSISAINGILGDYLQKENSSLAIPMGFYDKEKLISLNKKILKEIYPNFSSKICILVHGLCDDETTWKFKKDSVETYGSLLEQELGYTPLYIRYNSGLHISENGKQFSDLIETLLKVSPVSIKEIIIIAHSMGGLVTRSAGASGIQKGKSWIKKLRKVFFLGSPHEGAPLEKFGNVVTNVLEVIPNPFTKLTGKIINFRSSGIKDLRFGYISESDWKDKDENAFLKNNKNPVQLLEGVSYYVITGTLTENPKNIFSYLLGDSLVRKPSALGKSQNSKLKINFPEENHKEFPGISHIKLSHHSKVYEQILIWIKEK